MTFPPFDSYLASASRLKMNAAYVKPSLANLPIRALIVIVYGQNKLTTTMWKKMKGIHIGYFFTAPFFPRWLWKCRGEHPFEKPLLPVKLHYVTLCWPLTQKLSTNEVRSRSHACCFRKPSQQTTFYDQHHVENKSRRLLRAANTCQNDS